LEHLFSLHNEKWLAKDGIKNIKSIEKFSFLLTEYALSKKIDKGSKNRLEKLAGIRNRLVHYGMFPKGKYNEDALLVIFITEYIVTIILGLRPTKVYGTISKLEEFLKSTEKDNVKLK